MIRDDVATLMRHLEHQRESFDRLEHHLERHLEIFDRLERFLDERQEFDLVMEMAAEVGDAWFTSGEILHLARVRAEAAASTGLPEPDLSRALAVSRIETAHALGRWISDRVGISFERSGGERKGVRWRLSGEPAVSPDETA